VPSTAYAKRFEAVLAYVGSHLDGDLSVNALSRIAHFSAFHFHRQFTAYIGVPVSRYVQLMRLRRAAHQLVASPAISVLCVESICPALHSNGRMIIYLRR